MNKILWVKFGWSEYYRGGPVDGNFGWLNENKGKNNERRGHEAFNFNPGPDGTYYCYVPPQAREYAPSNDDPYGWTVICLAKNPKHTGVHIVGWYENATLHGEWLTPRMVYSKSKEMLRRRNWPMTGRTVSLARPHILFHPSTEQCPSLIHP